MSQSHPVQWDRSIRADDCIACRERLCRLVPANLRSSHQKFRLLQRGDWLGTEGIGTHALWIIIDGVAATCASLADGRRQILSFEFAGDVLCGMSVINHGDTRIEALTACHICQLDLPGSTVSDLKRSDVTASLFEQVHRRIEQNALHIISLGRLDSMERICLFLLDMARRTGRTEGNALQVDLCMSREDIADYLGLNAETVSRIMSRIKRLGLAVFFSPTAYIIPDRAALERRIPLGVCNRSVDAASRKSDSARCPL